MAEETIKLNPYIAFSRSAGKAEGAVLVVAPTAQRAKVLAWNSCISHITDEYIDVAVLRLDSWGLVYADGRDVSAECVIDDPPYCESCECWGVKVNGRECQNCYGDVGNRLSAAFAKFNSSEVGK